MPQAGDSYVIKLLECHLNWGTYRWTDTRDPIDGEAYIPIPLPNARRYDVRMGSTYNCTSSTGEVIGRVRAAGNRGRGEILAKQLQGDGDLKLLGSWLNNVCHAQVGSRVKVEWTSPNDIVLTYIP